MMTTSQDVERFPFLSSFEPAEKNRQAQSDMEKIIRLSPWHKKPITIIGGPGEKHLEELEEQGHLFRTVYTFVFSSENIQTHFLCVVNKFKEARPNKSLYRLNLLVVFEESEEYEIEAMYDFRKREGYTQ